MLLVLNLGISLTTVVLTPAEASMIPRIVPTAQLETAMGIFNLTLQASFAVGFAFLGPLIVSIAGPSFVLGVVAVFYAAATIATSLLPPAPPMVKLARHQLPGHQHISCRAEERRDASTPARLDSLTVRSPLG